LRLHAKTEKGEPDDLRLPSLRDFFRAAPTCRLITTSVLARVQEHVGWKGQISGGASDLNASRVDGEAATFPLRSVVEPTDGRADAD